MATTAGGVEVWSFCELRERAGTVPCLSAWWGEDLGCCTGRNAGARPPIRGHGVGGARERDWLGPGCG
jgi:hypothetical protein